MDVFDLILRVVLLSVGFWGIYVIVSKYFLPSIETLASVLHLPASVAGAALLTFGTSAPELFVNFNAFFRSEADIGLALGTSLGSAIAQIFVVIGVSAITREYILDIKQLLRDGLVYLFALATIFFVTLNGIIGLSEALFVFSLYGLYLFILSQWGKYSGESGLAHHRKRYRRGLMKIMNVDPISSFISTVVTFAQARSARLITFIEGKKSESKKSLFIKIIFSIFGLGLVTNLVVTSAEALAIDLGLSTTIIGLTVLALGTSTPEIIGSAVASKNGESEIALSNAFGSNIFVILVSFGLPAFMYTLFVGPVIIGPDITSTILLAFAALFTVIGVMSVNNFILKARAGYILLAIYVVYLVSAVLEIV